MHFSIRLKMSSAEIDASEFYPQKVYRVCV